MDFVEMILQKINARHEDLQRRIELGKLHNISQMESYGLLCDDVATMEIHNMILKEFNEIYKDAVRYNDWLTKA